MGNVSGGEAKSAPARFVAHPANFSARILILEVTFPKIWLFIFSIKGDLMIYQLSCSKYTPSVEEPLEQARCAPAQQPVSTERAGGRPGGAGLWAGL
jgi:hypothetical protein